MDNKNFFKNFQKINVSPLTSSVSQSTDDASSLKYNPEWDWFIPKNHYISIKEMFEDALKLSYQTVQFYQNNDNDIIIDLPMNALGKSKNKMDYLLFKSERINHLLFLHRFQRNHETDLSYYHLIGPFPVESLTKFEMHSWASISQIPELDWNNLTGMEYLFKQTPSRTYKEDDEMNELFQECENNPESKFLSLFGDDKRNLMDYFSKYLTDNNFLGYLKNQERKDISLLFQIPVFYSDTLCILVIPLDTTICRFGDQNMVQAKTAFLKTFGWFESIAKLTDVFTKDPADSSNTLYDNYELEDEDYGEPMETDNKESPPCYGLRSIFNNSQ